jgi:choice-of-anchor B domain-containing protein
MKTQSLGLLISFICLFINVSCSNDHSEQPNFAATWPCENGMADIYPCNGYDLMSYLSLEDLTPETINGGNIVGNDSWGWTDPSTNKEYALVGLSSHVAFVDLSDPSAPVLVGVLPTATVNSIWRDIKVY